MSPKKTFYLMIALTGMLFLALFGALFGGVKILQQSSDKLVAVKLQNRILTEQQTSLTSAKKAIKTYEDLNKISKAVVPQDKDQAQTVRSISTIAQQSGIRLSGISFPPSTLGQSSKSPAAKSKETQVTPVPGLKGVYQMDITVQSDTTAPISYETFLGFLAKLESNRRTAQVSNITILPDNTTRTKLTFNLVLTTYIKP